MKTNLETKEPGKSDFLFLKYCEGRRGKWSPDDGGPWSKQLGIFSKGPVGIREALGTVVGVFLQSLLYISSELERERKREQSRLEGYWPSPRIPASTQSHPSGANTSPPVPHCPVAQCGVTEPSRCH